MNEQAVWTRTLSSLTDQAGARAALTSHLIDAGLGPEPIADAVLVVTELSTNAFVHGEAKAVDVEVQQTLDGIRVRVRHGRTTDRSVPATATMPESSARARGRGLAIVHTVASDVRVEATGATVAVEATLVASA